MAAQPNRRIWVQNVAVEEIRLRMRLDALRARRLGFTDPEAEAVEAGVRSLLERAANAAYRIDPQPRRLPNWWRGTLVEAGYQNLHAAKAEIVQLYDEQELRAELPEALARIEEGLQQDDPRRAEARRMATATGSLDAASVRKLIETGYSAADQSHSRVRSFRNVVLMAASVLTIFLIAFAAYVSTHPNAVPLCFTSTEVAGASAATGAPSAGSATSTTRTICPTSETAVTSGGQASGGPAGRDVLVVALLGILGAGLASAISLRNVRGTSTPYDVPTSLAFLKVPTGALTAIAALVAIRGDFVPGLSILDSQEQILAYALVFGYAQQLLTGLVDRQGQNILASVPSKDSAGSRPSTSLPGGLPAGTAGSAADVDADDDVVVLEDPDPDAVEGGPVEVALDDPDDSEFDDSGTLLDDLSDDEDPNEEDPNELEASGAGLGDGDAVSVREPEPAVGTGTAPGGVQ
ncbi:MAG: hypothetical protein ACJ71T_02240 [Actinomycetales bacterium]